MQTTSLSLDNISEEAPGVLTFLPLLYVGWADAVLSPSEVKLIRNQIDKMDWLTPNEKQIINEWSNPANPPSEELFQSWVDVIRSTSTNLDDCNKQSMVDLGLQMANTGASSQAHRWSTKEARQALEDVEGALGYLTIKDFRNLLSEEQIKEQQTTTEQAASFDVQKMTRLLDGKHHELKEKVRLLLSDPAFELVTIRDKEKFRLRIMHWCQLLAKQGLGALAYGEEYGGKNDISQYAAVFETLGYHDGSLAIKFGVQFGLFGGSVQQLGTKKHHDKYLKDIGTLELSGCFAMTETGHGSNVRDCETTAIYDPETEEFVINTPHNMARKEYIGNSLHGYTASVFAQLHTKGEGHGVHAFIVPLKDEDGEHLPGIRVEDCGYKLGLNGVDNGQIWFDQVRVPRENLLDKFGSVAADGTYSSPIEKESRRFFTMLGTLVGGRVCVPQAGLSAAKTGLTIAIRHALNRRQFGPENEPETLLLDYPTHQRRLIPHLATTYATDFALKYLTERFTNKTEEDSREIETMAAAMKSFATWHTTATLQACREACGGKGYLAENRFADLKADTDIYTTFEGDNTVLMQLVAKGLLTEMKEEFDNANFWGIIKLVTKGMRESISVLGEERITNEEHLTSSEFQLKAFRHREGEILRAVASRMQGYRKRKMESYDIFLRCQVHMVELAEAYAERIILEQSIKKMESCEDPKLKRVLNDISDLYGLWQMQKHFDWYLEQGYLKPSKTKAIRKTIERLCLTLRKDARYLTDAFAIPEQSIGAPIALNKQL